MLHKRRLHRVQIARLPEAFDRRDLVLFMHRGKRQAGVHAPAIDVHRARAALAMIAALLGAGQVRALTQRIQQRRTRIHLHLQRLAIHAQIQRNGALDLLPSRTPAQPTAPRLAALPRPAVPRLLRPHSRHPAATKTNACSRAPEKNPLPSRPAFFSRHPSTTLQMRNHWLTNGCARHDFDSVQTLSSQQQATGERPAIDHTDHVDAHASAPPSCDRWPMR